VPGTLERKFVMQGAREAVGSGLEHISTQVEALERAVEENTALAFDLAKTIIESVCKTILSERNIAYANDDNMPKLIKSVQNCLPFLPPSESASIEARNSLRQTLGGLSSAVQGICELRNACGFASHGSNASRPQMEVVQATLAAEAADAIIGFLYRVHLQDRTIPQPEAGTFESDPGFDAYVDDLHPTVTIFSEDFSASRILFELAPEPYRLYLSEYIQEKEEGTEESEVGSDTVKETENA
jgi:hypothetical protein